MDLGLVVTTDAMHYDDPIPDFGIVAASEEPDGATPALMQGQGYENTGDRTMFWYSAWREGEVRLATWERDRLGYVSVDESWDVPIPHLWTCPIRVERGPARLFLNVEGVNENNRISVAVANERFEPLAGLAAPDCDPVDNGLRSPVRWGGSDVIAAEGPVRLQIIFEGLRAHDIKLYCAYLEAVS